MLALAKKELLNDNKERKMIFLQRDDATLFIFYHSFEIQVAACPFRLKSSVH